MPIPAPLRALLDSVFPWTTCAACREDAPLTLGLCAACAETLTPLAPGFDVRVGCVVAPAYAYDGAARAMIHRLKYSGEYDIARFLAPAMAQRAAQAAFEGTLVPVPLHPLRWLSRGYNQSATLCAEIGALTGRPHMRRALRRVRYTRAQMSLPGTQRASNVAGAFRASNIVAGRDIILVDDVMTTGSTINACIDALRGAGAARVSVLTACMVSSAAER